MNFALYLLIALLMFIILVLRNIFKAYVIYMLGDPTPRYRGLLSGNPINHTDPIGTLFLFLTPTISGGNFIFGWTKTVDYNPSYFKNKDLGEFIVGFTGLGSFFIFIFISKLLSVYFTNLSFIFSLIAYMSAFLFAINLIPLKGFDGGIILSVILKKIDKELFYKWEDFQYRNQLLILVLFFPLIMLLLPFFSLVARYVMLLAGW
ncbi:MAG: site-2 protease family protein [Candidatus Calescibacterium sp.]|nr:site-2 protease family protein [Candidatus Calescibacterium sp.]MCX7972263.1 site-2 protease family protein [bacterium]MDW8195135.1 site-2 protease family protein [Candidatus Calescibacterium sp.]